MNEIQRYLAEEIAEVCGQGHITRFEAMRRLRIMGVSAAVAVALLSACGSEDTSAPDAMNVESNEGAPGAAPSNAADPPMAAMGDDPAVPGSASATPAATEGNVTPTAPPAGAAAAPPTAAPTEPAPADSTPPVAPLGMAIATEAITFDGPRGQLQAAWASAAQPRGAVLVIHENRGLNDHTRSVAGRFAAAGYSALALDLLSQEGGTASLGETATAALGIAGQMPQRFVDDMRAGLDELARRVPNAKLGAIGFCFGGGQMWRLVASGDPRLAAVAPFYGTLPQGADFTGSNAAVLGVYGELDARVNATRDAAEAALTQAGLTHEIVTFPGANHAFFNDTGPNFNAAAADQAWARVLEWFGQNLG